MEHHEIPEPLRFSLQELHEQRLSATARLQAAKAQVYDLQRELELCEITSRAAARVVLEAMELDKTKPYLLSNDSRYFLLRDEPG